MSDTECIYQLYSYGIFWVYRLSGRGGVVEVYNGDIDYRDELVVFQYSDGEFPGLGFGDVYFGQGRWRGECEFYFVVVYEL